MLNVSENTYQGQSSNLRHDKTA